MTNENDPAQAMFVRFDNGDTRAAGLTALEHTCLTTLTLDDRLPRYMYDAILARLRWDAANGVMQSLIAENGHAAANVGYVARCAIAQADAMIAELVKPKPEVR